MEAILPEYSQLSLVCQHPNHFFNLKDIHIHNYIDTNREGVWL